MLEANQDAHGLVCLVTGASAGIGRATARRLAASGAQVILVARDAKRGEAARREISQETGNRRLRLLVTDLSAQSEVRNLAATVARDYPALDVLINNAAIIPQQRTITQDGLEMQFAVNYLAPFLLTNLLLPKLKASAPARVINVSSQTHSGAQIPFDDLQSARRYNSSAIYAWTKLALILFTRELARRVVGVGVTVNALHPGVVRTKLLYDYMGVNRRERGRDAGQGSNVTDAADQIVYLATAPEVSGTTGCYFRDKRPVSPSPAAKDQAVARRLWEISAELTDLS